MRESVGKADIASHCMVLPAGLDRGLRARVFTLFRVLVHTARSTSSAVLTLIGTVVLAAAGLAYVACLRFFPASTPNDSVYYAYLDKRWILGLFVLGVCLVYLPLALRRLIDCLRGATSTPSGLIIEKKLSIRRCIVILLFGFGLALLDMGPHISTTLEQVWEAHELVHLGPLQRIAKGGTPYVEAQT